MTQSLFRPLPVEAIANWFIEKSLSTGRGLTAIGVSKFIYFSYAWSLAINDIYLIEDQIFICYYGTVIPKLSNSLLKYGGSGKITEEIVSEGDVIYKVLPGSGVDKFLERIWETHSYLTDIQLVNLTHERGSPVLDILQLINQKPGNPLILYPLNHNAVRDFFKNKVSSSTKPVEELEHRVPTGPQTML